jgi:hypothetical protein
MRITREILMKAARDNVAQMVRQNRRLICIYLTGSMVKDDPLLGGTTDIDLVVIHDDDVVKEREIVRLTDEIHFDIAHFAASAFRQPRSLRVDPWIGSYMCLNPICLHDSQHWFEFTQAGICAQCDRPEYVLQRARSMAEQARQKWFELASGNNQNTHAVRLGVYINSLERAANAIALLSGPPLTERRLLLDFPESAQNIDRPGLAAGLADLLMNELPEDEEWGKWMSAWEENLADAGKLENCPPRLDPRRKFYYLRPAAALREDFPEAALWIMLRNWTLAVSTLANELSSGDTWLAACNKLELDDDHFKLRLDELDAYLDTVEETLDVWGKKYGVL